MLDTEDADSISNAMYHLGKIEFKKMKPTHYLMQITSDSNILLQ